MIFLIEPSDQYKESFLEGVRDFQHEDRCLNYDVERISENFEDFLQQERRQKDMNTCSPGRVPSSNFWLINEREYVGLLTVRHRLNDFLLKVGGNIGYQIRPSKRGQGYGKQLLHLGLQKAREMGIPRALVTCDENNVSSKKVIEYNGGQFEDAVEVEGSSVKKLRYWIDLHL